MMNTKAETRKRQMNHIFQAMTAEDRAAVLFAMGLLAGTATRKAITMAFEEDKASMQRLARKFFNMADELRGDGL
jgi:hypothetical protein